MIRVWSRRALITGLALLVAGFLIIIHATMTHDALECINVNFINSSCFTVSKPGIICVRNAKVPVLGLREVNVSAINGCTVQYSVNKAGTYCLSSALPTEAELTLCRFREPGLSELLYWFLGAVMVLVGGGLLYRYATSMETVEAELLEEYIINEGAVCRSLSLTRHECRVRQVSSCTADFIREASEFMCSKFGYRQRELAETYAILTRGKVFGLGDKKPVSLLMYVDNNDVVLEFRVAPLQASGLYDLKRFAEEVKALLRNVFRSSKKGSRD